MVTCWHICNLSKVGNVPVASCAVISCFVSVHIPVFQRKEQRILHKIYSKVGLFPDLDMKTSKYGVVELIIKPRRWVKGKRKHNRYKRR